MSDCYCYDLPERETCDNCKNAALLDALPGLLKAVDKIKPTSDSVKFGRTSYCYVAKNAIKQLHRERNRIRKIQEKV